MRGGNQGKKAERGGAKSARLTKVFTAGEGEGKSNVLSGSPAKGSLNKQGLRLPKIKKMR